MCEPIEFIIEMQKNETEEDFILKHAGIRS
jgi:hypothetical protein